MLCVPVCVGSNYMDEIGKLLIVNNQGLPDAFS